MTASITNAGEIKLTGWPLWLGRLAWLVVAVLVLLTLSQVWPENFWATYGEWVVSRTRPAVSIFMAYGDFVRFVALLESLSAVTALGMGLLVLWRKSADRMGLFASAFLMLSAPWYISSNMELWRLPTWVPFGPILTWLQAAATLGSVILFIYLFPNGQFFPRWTRGSALLGLSVIGLFLVTTFSPQSPSSVVSDSLWLIFSIPLVGSLVVAGASQVYRYRTCSDPVQRQQMKWVVFGLGLYVATLLISFLSNLRPQSAWEALIELLIRLLVGWLIPLTIGFSMLRYGLWAVDVWINRTLVYGTLTALVVLAYVLLVGGLGLLLRGDNAWLAVISTGLVALAVNPLHAWLQRAINRLLYGEQNDPVQVLATVGTQLEVAAEPDALLPTLVRTVATTLKLPYVAVSLSDDVAPVAAYGVISQAVEIWPLTYQGAVVGTLTVGRRAAHEPFNRHEQRLLETIAHQAGAAAHALHLTAELRQSRQRLVIAREEERRRLRRDLHDGLGPRLASLTLKLDAAGNLLARDPQVAAGLLTDLKAQTQAAIADVRRLVYDLRPPALDQLGLVGALHEHAARVASDSLAVQVRAPDDLPALPAAVEVAAYRIATEALTNVVRHAHAQRCTIWLCLDHALHLAVDDDGMGLPDNYQAGVGIASMRERAEELGGACRIARRAEGGTRVSARLPFTATN
ncbi:sensor histidine kinase [Candidatus Amarolinea aalborgensis]|uniref:sensor histidine kinase n=1 Tax=Candidatus Amarolinea aalborgensis TaxID=2249329 RepID=UPI003BF9CDF3